MTAVELPPPSPALAVHRAAARIREIADRASWGVATNPYWDCGWASGVKDAIGGAEGDLAALVSPELAVLLADWLDERASASVRAGAPIPPLALAIAEATHPTP
ncbi:hypothetical protein [Streptomyces sp. NPDC002853]